MGTIRNRIAEIKSDIKEYKAVSEVKDHVERNKATYSAVGITFLVTLLGVKLVQGGSYSPRTKIVAKTNGHAIVDSTIVNHIYNVGNDALEYVTREIGTKS